MRTQFSGKQTERRTHQVATFVLALPPKKAMLSVRKLRQYPVAARIQAA